MCSNSRLATRGRSARSSPTSKAAALVLPPARTAPMVAWCGTCGGCVAQHMSASLYRAWKRDLVVQALKREDVAAEVGDFVDAHGAGRRRATFHARFPHGQPDEVGFM